MTNAIKQEIVEQYGLIVHNVKTIHRLMFRRSYYIETEQGAFIYKYYPKNSPIEHFDEIAEVAVLLNNNNISTPLVIKTRNSCLFTANSVGYFVLFSYIPGTPICSSDSMLAAHLLCRLHTKCKGQGLHEKINIPEAIDNFSKFKQIEGDELAKKISNKFVVAKKTFMEYPTPRQVIHGDYTLNNVISKNGTGCVIDLDTVRLGHPEEDIASFVLSLIYMETPLNLEKSFGNILMFLHGYYGTRLNKQKVQELMFFIRFRCAYELSRHASEYIYLRRCPGMKKYLCFLLEHFHNYTLEDFLCKKL